MSLDKVVLDQKKLILKQIRMIYSFIRDSQLVVKKPIVNRTLGFKISNDLHIAPAIYLKMNGVEYRLRMQKILVSDHGNVPHIFWSLFSKIYPKDEFVGYHIKNESTNRFIRELFKRWPNFAVIKEKQLAIDKIWNDVDINKNKILEEYKGKHTSKEIKKFSSKILRFAQSNPSMLNCDHEFLYKFFNMDPKFIQKLLAFSKRNAGDMEFLDEESFEEVCRVLIVSSIIKS